MPCYSWKLQHPEFLKRQQSEVAAAAHSDNHLVTDLAISPSKLVNWGELHCDSPSPTALWQLLILFLHSNKRYNIIIPQLCCPTADTPTWSLLLAVQPQLSITFFYLWSHGLSCYLFFLTDCNLNIRLEAGIFGGEFLLGGTKSEEEWMATSNTCEGEAAEEVMQSQRDLLAAERWVAVNNKTKKGLGKTFISQEEEKWDWREHLVEE